MIIIMEPSRVMFHVRTRNGSGDIIDMDNAFWLDSYKSMFYGDGLGSGPTVSLDIC